MSGSGPEARIDKRESGIALSLAMAAALAMRLKAEPGAA